MRIWDVFPYWRERWAVDARTRLWAGVDGYTPVALVGDRTHRGNPLPEEPDPGVESVRVVLDADGDWAREEQQRDAVRLLLPAMDPDDLILLCDADEFVDPRVLPRIVEGTARGLVKLHMAHYMCGTRWRHANWWRHAGACRARDLPEHPSRDLRMNFALLRILEAGWHLTYMGTDDDVDLKLKSYAHAETDNEQTRREVADIRANGTGFIDDPLTGPLAEILAGFVAGGPVHGPQWAIMHAGERFE